MSGDCREHFLITLYIGSGEATNMLQNCNKKNMKCVKSKEKVHGFLFSLAFVSLGFNDSKALNLLGRILIRGFAVGRRQHRRWRYKFF
jgi:hypothetical protein